MNQPDLFATKQLSHGEPTSVAAIEKLTASGKRQSHMKVVANAVRSNPHKTAGELIKITGLREYQVRRRLTDLKNQGLITQGDARLCTEGESLMVTWFAPESAQ